MSEREFLFKDKLKFRFFFGLILDLKQMRVRVGFRPSSGLQKSARSQLWQLKRHNQKFKCVLWLLGPFHTNDWSRATAIVRPYVCIESNGAFHTRSQSQVWSFTCRNDKNLGVMNMRLSVRLFSRCDLFLVVATTSKHAIKWSFSHETQSHVRQNDVTSATDHRNKEKKCFWCSSLYFANCHCVDWDCEMNGIEINTERIINEIQVIPGIWDLSSNDYADRDKKDCVRLNTVAWICDEK